MVYNGFRYYIKGFLGLPESRYKSTGVGSPRIADWTASDGDGDRIGQILTELINSKRRYQRVDFATRAMLSSKLRITPESEYIIMPRSALGISRTLRRLRSALSTGQKRRL